MQDTVTNSAKFTSASKQAMFWNFTYKNRKQQVKRLPGKQLATASFPILSTVGEGQRPRK